MSGRVKRDCQCPRFKHEHGTYLAYEQDQCRCFPCALAWSQAKARARAGGRYTLTAGLVDRTGTDRRIQALLAIGWRHSDISTRMTAHLGRPANSGLILKHPGRTVFTATAAVVAIVYDELSMTLGPSQRNRNRAAKLGYLPPLAWDDDTIDDPAATPEMTYVLHALGKINPPFYKGIRDNGGRPANPGPDAEILDEIAIEEAIAGRPVQLTRAEETVAQQRMRAMGYSQREIAERLRIAKRTVERRGRAA